jgi:menaquinone-9 beta-reductase
MPAQQPFHAHPPDSIIRGELDFDVAIFGAGPAGTACALALHGKGLKVALFDKESFPRDKICGDAIPGPSFKALDYLNPNWGKQLRSFAAKEEVLSSAALLPGNKKLSYHWLSYSYNSKRLNFDHFLFELVEKETETQLFTQHKLLKIQTHPTHVACEFQNGTKVKVGMAIGCDGAHSVVKRNLQPPSKETQTVYSAVRAYYQGIEGIQPGENEFHYIEGIHSYFWIFPLQNGWANIGFGIINDKKKKESQPTDIRHTLDEIIALPAFAGRFKKATRSGPVNGFALPIWTKNSPLSGQRFLLCGDAANLIDPLFGHGIDKALWSGILAAEHTIKAFQTNDFSPTALQQYDLSIEKKFGKEQRLRYRIMRLMVDYPRLKNLVFSLTPPPWLLTWIIKTMKF